jgi:anti-anti-sigma regulatory factor
MTENISQDTLLVDLAPEPQMCDELDSINQTMSAVGYRDLVVDFSNADIVTASSLSKLMKLRQMLTDSGRRLVLCGLSRNTRGIFSKTALDRIFEFAANKSAVLMNN